MIPVILLPKLMQLTFLVVRVKSFHAMAYMKA